MAKQTKNIITRDEIKNTLLTENGKKLRFHLIIGILLFLFFLPLNIWLLIMTWSLNNSIFIRLLLALLDIVVLDALFIVDMIVLVNVIIKRKKIERDEFDISIRSLIYKDDTVYRPFKIQRLLKFSITNSITSKISKNLHFSDFDAEEVSGTTYDLASNGDDFYIVHFKGEKEVELIYPAKMYDFK